jgi:hypothetical protein
MVTLKTYWDRSDEVSQWRMAYFPPGGMVMRPEVICSTLEEAVTRAADELASASDRAKPFVYYGPRRSWEQLSLRLVTSDD